MKMRECVNWEQIQQNGTKSKQNKNLDVFAETRLQSKSTYMAMKLSCESQLNSSLQKQAWQGRPVEN